MATIQVTADTKTGTVAASDRYEVEFAKGVLTAATATTASSTAWTFVNGKLVITNDAYTSGANAAPDTLAIKFIAPSNLINNQWGGLADMQAALFPSMQPITLAWTGVTTNKSGLTSSTQEDLRLATIDYRPTANAGALTFAGFDKNADKIVLETYQSTGAVPNAKPFETENLGLRTGFAGVVQTTPATSQTSTQTISQTGNYQWVFAAQLQNNSNLTSVNYDNEHILTASVYQLSTNNVIDTNNVTQAGFVAQNWQTDTQNWQQGISNFRADMQVQVQSLLPGGDFSNPQQIPDTRWGDLEINLNFAESAFSETNQGLSSPLILDGAYQLNNGRYFSQNNYTSPTQNVTLGTQYTIFLDPNAKNSQSIAIQNNYTLTDNHNTDVVSYSNWGINSDGRFDVVEAGTGALTSTSFTSSTPGATLNFSGDVTTVERPSQGAGSSTVTDKFSGIEGFFLTTGKDIINIDTTLTSNFSNGTFSGSLTGNNSGDVGKEYFVMGGLGVDTYNIKTTGSTYLNPNASDSNLSIKDLGILLADGAKENSGVVYNLGASNITYLSAITSTSLNNDGSAKFQLKDGYGNVEDLNFASNAFVKNIYTEGTAFRDIYSVTDNGGRGHYGNLYVQASRGNDSVNQDQDSAVWNTGGNAVNYSDYSGPLKAVGITLDYSNFGDLAPLKKQEEDSWASGKLVESARVDSGLYAFTNTVWKAGYGMDNYQTGSKDSYNEVTLQFTDQSDYAEYDGPRVNTDDLNFEMGGGKDLVYLNLPWIANEGALSKQATSFDNVGSKQIDVALGWSDGNHDNVKDQLQIDLTNIEKHLGTLQIKEVNIEGFDFGLDKLSFVTQNARLDGSLSSFSSALSGQSGLTSTGSESSHIVVSKNNDNQLSISYKNANGTTTDAIKINFTQSNGSLSSGNAADSLQFVSDRSIAQYAPVYMTDNADSAILNEDSGYAGPGLGIYDFKAGDDLVTLYKGDLDVALGAGNDTVRVHGDSGNSIVIGGAGIDKLFLNGLESDWNFSVLTTTQAAQMLADKYGAAAPTNMVATDKDVGTRSIGQFGIEQDAADLNVVIMGTRSPSLLNQNTAYTELEQFDQTIIFQAETIEFSDVSRSSDTLLGSMSYSLDLIGKAVDRDSNQTFYGRRGTDADSITITTDTAGVMNGLKNIRSLIDTGTDIIKDPAALNISKKLAGSVLDGSTINKLDLKQIAASHKAVDYFVDVEKIVLTDGTAANTFTIRLAGSNGYSSVDAAMGASNFGDIIYVADTLESVLNNKGSQAASTVNNVTIKSGLGIAFEANATTAFEVTVSESKANTLPSGDVANIPGFGIGAGAAAGQVALTEATRVTYLLGDNAVNVQGSGLNDVIIGNRGANILRGGGGDDVLIGGAGADILMGQTGDDTLIGLDKDYLNAGSGNDTLYVGGTTRTNATTFDTQVAIAGAGNDKVVLLKNNGQVNAYLGSGTDEVVVSGDWVNTFAKTGSGATTVITKNTASDPVAKILDFSTTADTIKSPNTYNRLDDAGIKDDLNAIGITIQQLIVPEMPLGTAHEYPLGNESTVTAAFEGIDFNGTGAMTASVAELVNAYKLVNG